MTVLHRHERDSTLDLHNPDGTHVDLGQFRIEAHTGSFSGKPIYTLQYMGPPESFGYGVWEDVKTFDSQADAEGFQANPEPWFANGDDRYRRLAEHLAEHERLEAERLAAGLCPFINWGVPCVRPAGHPESSDGLGGHEHAPDAFPMIP